MLQWFYTAEEIIYKLNNESYCLTYDIQNETQRAKKLESTKQIIKNIADIVWKFNRVLDVVSGTEAGGMGERNI